jgi:hypothetical protein
LNRRITSTLGFILLAFLLPSPALRSTPELTLDDLKKLEITCFVPSYLPEGFKLQRVDITFDDNKHSLPLYSVMYSNDPRKGATFSIESAREGIGDRNLMADEENAEETEIKTPLGPMYLIYRPKGKTGRKAEIISNWMTDANMKAEEAKNPGKAAVLGRFHGFSGFEITLAEFTKIVQSLHPVRPGAAAKTSAPVLKVHPKVFNLIECWISDVESPVVTEINLDAVDKNGNEFNDDGLRQEGEWTRCPVPDANGFMMYRLLESKGDHYKVEYRENGGGSLTTASIIDFVIEKREIQRDGKPAAIRVLRVLSYLQKPG